MLNFHVPTARDYEWIQPILYKAGLPGADNTFQSMYFWDGYYGEVGLAEGFVTQHLTQDGAEVYLYPAGAGDERPALEAVLQDARERGGQLRLRGVTPDKRETLERLSPESLNLPPIATPLTISTRSRSWRSCTGKASGQAKPLQPLRGRAPGLQNAARHAGDHPALPRDDGEMVRGARLEREDRV